MCPHPFFKLPRNNKFICLFLSPLFQQLALKRSLGICPTCDVTKGAENSPQLSDNRSSLVRGRLLKSPAHIQGRCLFEIYTVLVDNLCSWFFFDIAKQEFKLKVSDRHPASRPLQVDSEDIGHRAIQFHRFLPSAKTLMQLQRLALRPLLHSRLSFFLFCFFHFFLQMQRVCRPKPNFLKGGEKSPQCAVCSSGTSRRRIEENRGTSLPRATLSWNWDATDPWTSILALRNQSHGNLLCTRKPRRALQTPRQPIGSENRGRIVLRLLFSVSFLFEGVNIHLPVSCSSTAICFSVASTRLRWRKGSYVIGLFPYFSVATQATLLQWTTVFVFVTIYCEYVSVCVCVCCARLSLRVKCGQIKTNIVVMCFATCGHGPGMTPLYSCDQLQWTVLVLCRGLGLLSRSLFSPFFFPLIPPWLPDRNKIKSVKLQSAHICLLSQQLRFYYGHANDFMTYNSCRSL